MNVFKKLTLASILSLFAQSYQAQDLYEDRYQWQIPGGQYIDPVSFFSLHGYVNALYAGPSDQWKEGNFNGIGMPGQVLLPNSNVSSFNSDQALWIGSELNSRTSVIMELHLVSDPSGRGAAGPGGLTFVLTEANLRYSVIEQYLNLSAGTFWSVFGIQNQDWLGAQNLFSLIPLASGAYITHYNEKGIRLDGSADIGKWGINYVASIGNGFNAYDISGYTSFDLNENKMFNSRISVFPGLEENLNIGFSVARGMLHKQDLNADPSSKQFFNSDFQALGVDLTWIIQDLKLRSYLISSKEMLSSATDSRDLEALGAMAELSYNFDISGKTRLKSISPKVRFDYLDKNEFIEAASDTYQNISIGANIILNESLIISADYNLMEESRNTLTNNRFVLRFSANF